MTLIPQGYGCGISHSRIYLISTTHSFLISYRFFFSTVFVLDSPAATPYLWQGTLQADASLHIARRFPESLADYNLESILFLMGRNSYHYPPPMILAKDLRKSIHSYKNSLKMRTSTDNFFHEIIHPSFWTDLLITIQQCLSPSVLALMLSRFYLWERTCNAGI